MTNTTHPLLLIAAESFSSLYRRLRQRLGRPSETPGQQITANTDLSRGRARRSIDGALPVALQQAFSAQPLVAGDPRFVARAEPLSRFQTVLDLWRRGQRAAVAVSGPQGCGITSLLQQLTPHVDDPEAWCYGELTHRPDDLNDSLGQICSIIGCAQPVSSVEQLVEIINARPPSVFIIDNGHFLGCRIMGTNAAIGVFGAILVATQHRHLWVLGCEEQAWRRLTYVHRADRYFSEHIELRLFSEAELGECLDARLRASAIAQISNQNTDESTDQNENQGADQSAQRSGAQLQPQADIENLLGTLYKLSNGKPDFAFFYVLSALAEHREGKLSEVQPPAGLDFSLLKQLISEELFTLAETAAHGQMTVDGHRALFRCSRNDSSVLLERLYQQCLLDKSGDTNDPAYRLTPLYSEVIARFLTNANYLY